MQYSTEFCHTRSTNRHRKELENITKQKCDMQEDTEQELSCCLPEGTAQDTCRNNKYTFTLTELRELVTSAQHGNSQAIEQLCTAFKPLIYKEAYRYEIRKALGEDAINIAWLIFLEKIKSYKDRDFGHLPGLLQYHVHFGLLHKFTRGKSVKDCYYLDAEENEETQIADKKNDIDQLVYNQLLSEAMKKLTDAQYAAVNELVLQDMDYKIFSKQHNCSVKTAFKHRANGLSKLKELLA